jgi:hypothetical protein
VLVCALPAMARKNLYGFLNARLWQTRPRVQSGVIGRVLHHFFGWGRVRMPFILLVV